MPSGLIEALSSRLGSALRLQHPLRYFSWEDGNDTHPSPTSNPVPEGSHHAETQREQLPGAAADPIYPSVIREGTGASLSTLVDHSATPETRPSFKISESKPLQVSPSPTVTSTSTTRLRNGIPLPGTKDMIWLYQPIHPSRWSQEVYQTRFEFVINELKKAVECHDTLCDRLDSVTWSLRMVGPSPDTSAPAIIVGCHKDDEEGLRDVFYRCAQRRLNCRVKPKKPFQRTKKPSTKKPAFNIFMLPRPDVPISRVSADQVTLSIKTDLKTLCGSQVYFNGRSATLGVTLTVGGTNRILTVQHLFEPHSPLGQANMAERTVKWDGLSSIKAHRAQAPLPLLKSCAYLDWSLIDAPEGASQHNTVCGASTSTSLQLREIGTRPRLQETPVYMASGLHGMRSGILLCGLSYISTRKGRKLCPVWTWVPESGSVENGESGSVVFDQETLKVYGHLIGVDTYLGCGYIVPLTETIHQVKEAFNSNDVALSGPTTKAPTELDMQERPEMPKPLRTSHKMLDKDQHLMRSSNPPNCHRTAIRDFSERAKRTLAWPSLSGPWLITLFALGTFIPSLSPTAPMLYTIPTNPPYHSGHVNQHHECDYEQPMPSTAVRQPYDNLIRMRAFDLGLCINLAIQRIHQTPWIFADLHDVCLATEAPPLTITVETCQELCGSSPGRNFYTDAGRRLRAWIFPIILLLANIELVASDTRWLFVWFQVLGDPIGTVYSLLHKLQTWSRYYEMSTLSVTQKSPRGVKHHRIRILATVLAGFRELTVLDLGMKLPDTLLDRFYPNTESMLRVWTQAALELMEARTDQLFRAIIAVAIYTIDLLAALILVAEGSRLDTPIAQTTIGLSLSFLIPIVLLTNFLGVPRSQQTLRDIYDRFLSAAKDELAANCGEEPEVFIDQLEDCAFGGWHHKGQSWWGNDFSLVERKGGKNDDIRAKCETRYIRPRNNEKSRALGVFLLSLLPICAGALGAWRMGRSLNFTAHALPLNLLTLWLLSAALLFGMRVAVSRGGRVWIPRYYYWHLSFGIRLIVVGMTLFRIVATSVAPQQPLETLHATVRLIGGDNFTLGQMVGTIVLGTIGFQLVFTIFVTRLYWKGLAVMRWSELKRKQVWQDSQGVSELERDEKLRLDLVALEIL